MYTGANGKVTSDADTLERARKKALDVVFIACEMAVTHLVGGVGMCMHVCVCVCVCICVMYVCMYTFVWCMCECVCVVYICACERVWEEWIFLGVILGEGDIWWRCGLC